MGLSGSNRHKRKKSGGKKTIHCDKRKCHLAREPANTRLGPIKIQKLRVRGGNIKRRALKINSGLFTLKSNKISLNAQFNQVMYHPSSNELMRTNTITKGVVVRFDNVLSDKVDLNTFKEKDPLFYDNINQNKLYGIVQSRPGQCGRADGYFLQGEELKFYMEKFKKRNK